MSRIGRAPIQVPAGVEVKSTATSSKSRAQGSAHQELHPEMKVELSDGTIVVTRPSDEKAHRSSTG